MSHRARADATRPISHPGTGMARGLALVLLALLVAPAASFALPVGHELLYDVDFESPIHTRGQTVGVDLSASPRSGPSQVVFGDPTVVAQHGALTDQPLSFTGNADPRLPAGRYDQIRFDLDRRHDQVAMSFDLLVAGPPGAGTLGTPSFSLFVDRSGGISRIDFLPDGTVRHWDPALSASTLWFRHRPDRAHHYELLVDLEAELITLVQDDAQHLLALGPTAAGRDGSVLDLRFNSVGTEGQAIAALDNVVISGMAVPEPGTALLLTLGLAMTGRRHRARRRG